MTYALAGVFGALFGSFMNVCISRIPAEESIVTPGSHCRACGTPIRWFDNIPLLSYVLLAGRCRACRAPFSPRYVIVEALSTLLALALWHGVTPSLEALWRAPLLWAFEFAFVGVLIVVSFIDLATYRIPNVITYPGIPLFTAASLLLDPPHLWDGPLGAVLGYALLRGLSDAYFWLTKREGMGYGDAKLLSLVAGFLGWQSLLPTIFVGSAAGSVVGIAVALIRRRAGNGETSIRLTRIPFGPFLALGALVYLFFGDLLARWVWMI